MYLNDLPQGFLQVTVDGKVIVLSESDQRVMVERILTKHPEWNSSADEHSRYCTNSIERGHKP